MQNNLRCRMKQMGFSYYQILSDAEVFTVTTLVPVQQSGSASGLTFLKQENLIMVFTSLIMVNTFILLVPPHLKLLNTLTFFCIILDPLVCCVVCAYVCTRP